MFTLKLNTPLGKKEILKLKAGDFVELSGTVFTARDKAHEFLLKNKFPKIKNKIIYHCGPIVKQKGKKFEIVSAGPTTSSRMNSYTPALISKYSIPAIIGKAGMDDNVKKALKGKAVYFAAIGGLGAKYAKCITQVKSVYKKEFGMPEAIWELGIKDFPLVVGMDAKGKSIFK
ncbi:MAG: FumA C-terminus/TtdB family hydratase beta subunit [Candidatus Diapherotrites archaeon]